MDKSIFDDVLGYSLDNEQKAVVIDDSPHLLVVAGAGSGKTLTIVGKIRYLIEVKKYKPEEILCISFTNKSMQSLKDKINNYYGYNMDIYTFHKLGLEILKEKNNEISIAPSDYLDYIVEEYFNVVELDEKMMIALLKYFKVPLVNNILNTYNKFIMKNTLDFRTFKNTISRFIHLVKEKNMCYEDILMLMAKIKEKLFYFNKAKTITFLFFALSIYKFYQEELISSLKIDFSDMILLATKQVEDIGIKNNYKYIIIDEYQDTSMTRFLLIKAIIAKTGAHLLVVGDDFQSIYRFTGCNLDLFLNFSEYFSDSKILKITNTYRNSQELIDIAGKFIMKNKKQIHKNLKTKNHLDTPIEIISVKDEKLALKKLLDNLPNKEILILGRNNFDIFPFLDEELTLENSDKISYKRRKELSISYLTVHKSKGLEADIVILIHVTNDYLGFPSKKSEDKYLSLLSEEKDAYLYEEERRLFYVALTRTKSKVYILTEPKSKSIFVKELIHDLKQKNI